LCQAEDGIRDWSVTGVQTCALPIFGRGRDLLVDQRLEVLVVDVFLAVGERLEAHEGVLQLVAGKLVAQLLKLVHEGVPARMLARSEERRVGKEWRCRWSEDDVSQKR